MIGFCTIVSNILLHYLRCIILINYSSLCCEKRIENPVFIVKSSYKRLPSIVSLDELHIPFDDPGISFDCRLNSYPPHDVIIKKRHANDGVVIVPSIPKSLVPRTLQFIKHGKSQARKNSINTSARTIIPH